MVGFIRRQIKGSAYVLNFVNHTLFYLEVKMNMISCIQCVWRMTKYEFH
jgi:hypothetical protein